MVVIDMPRAPREKSESGIYHIMIRGANRQKIIDTIEKVQLGRIKSFPKLRESRYIPKAGGKDCGNIPQPNF
jgi:S-ribosylhomocysteine lyase LuxS involved in autoinducer biosynthesis